MEGRLDFGRTKAPIDGVRQDHAARLTGLLENIATVAEFTFDCMKELRDDGLALKHRIDQIDKRVCTLTKDFADMDSLSLEGSSSIPSPQHGHETENPCSQLFQKYINELYEKCEPVPIFVTNGHGCNNDSIAKFNEKFSNPRFVLEDWKKHEEHYNKKANQGSIIMLKTNDGNNIANLDMGKDIKRSDDDSAIKSDHNNKVAYPKHKLGIRSWREVYGSGESKELKEDLSYGNTEIRLEQSLRSKVNERVRRASFSLMSFTASTLSGAFGSDVVASEKFKGTCTSELKYSSSEPSNLTSKLTSFKENAIPQFSSPFLQELDDAELGEEIQDGTIHEHITSSLLQDIYNEDILEATFPAKASDGCMDDLASTKHVAQNQPTKFMHNDSDNFATSEYIIPPPPPPLPDQNSEDEQSSEDSESFSDCPSQNGMQDFNNIWIPPPPPLEYAEESTYEGVGDSSSFPPPDKNLGKVTIFNPHLNTYLMVRNYNNEQDSPSLKNSDDFTHNLNDGAVKDNCNSFSHNLLQQIKLKQQLRHVDRQHLIRSNHPTAPLCKDSSISRILERRNFVAYDSDSEQSLNKKDGEDESESEW